MFKYFVILFSALSAAVPGILAFQFERVIGSQKAEPNEFPYIAAIMVIDNTSDSKNCLNMKEACPEVLHYHCNGVIISPQFVLTTGQCILDKKYEVDKIRIRTGTNNPLGNEGETYEVESFDVHYDIRNDIYKTVVYTTIGVYKLKKPLNVNYRQKPIRFAPLPRNIIVRDPPDWDIKGFSLEWLGTVVGWGIFDPARASSHPPQPNSFSPVLLKMQETVVIERFPRCKRFMKEYGLTYDGHEVCGFTAEKMGNDGAALIYDNTLVGVAIHYKYVFYNVLIPRMSTGSLFAYTEYLKNFINATATDYYS